jgi:NAD(P)-dependent dehydrogenase (short-subunit alcohol dehydrogenase family)
MARLQGKRALITGGASGIGLQTLRQFVSEGARVAITARRVESFEPVRQEFNDKVICIASDAGNAADQRRVADIMEQNFGGLDILFANAGIADLRPIDQWNEEAWDHCFHTNVRGPFFLIQALLPLFASPASVILNASINAHIGMPNTSVYGASKAALLSLARTLSGELIARGIRVNAVSPGPTATPLYGKLGLSTADLKTVSESLQKQLPVGRFGAPSEIASAVVYLASDESAFTVGSELIIDGGLGL